MKAQTNAKQVTSIELVRRALAAAVLTVAMVTAPAGAQEQGGGASNPDSPAAARSIPASPNLFRGQTWKQLVENVLADEAKALTFPSRMKTDAQWATAVALVGGTTALVMLDPTDTPYFRRTGDFERFNRTLSGLNTGLALAAVPGVFYLVSEARGDNYGTQTVFEAGEAVLDAQLVTIGAKMIDRRFRPSDIAPSGDFSDTWFNANIVGGKSFPSGHTTTAFALAQVFSSRYRQHRWVPWVAYGLATLVGFSRVTVQAHFPSDVFAGAAIGVVMARDLVLPRNGR
jgi:membrane-associated phospholipid phosphatase